MIACRRYQNGFAMQAKAIVTRNANADKCGIIAQEKINSSPSWQKARVAAISQPTHSNAFSWMIFFFFFLLLKFQWSLFLSVQLAMSQHWFR